MSLHKLDDREHATVLAALRLYDYVLAEWPDVAGETDVHDIATKGGEVKKLNGRETDLLCERLNTEADIVTPLLQEVVGYEHEAFNTDGEVDGGDLVEWFAEFRQRAFQAL